MHQAKQMTQLKYNQQIRINRETEIKTLSGCLYGWCRFSYQVPSLMHCYELYVITNAQAKR